MVKYNRELLDECLTRDCATLYRECEKLNRDTKIQFKCNCGNDGEKTFKLIYDSGGAYCEGCVNKNKTTKTKKTNLEKYGTVCCLNNKDIIEKIKKTNLNKLGVEWPTQSQEVKDKIKQKNMENLGVEFPSQSQEVKDKIKLVNIEKYGVECHLQSQGVKDKIKLTNMEKYGVENPSQNEDVKNKKIKTSLKNYGVNNPMQHPDILEKCMQTNMEKYGVENPSKNEDVKNKKIKTSLKNYGVNNPMQHPDILEKCMQSSYRIKDYILPSGNILKYQGYENFALDKIIKEWKIEETDIITRGDKIPEIWWLDKDKKRRYFVDIYIPSMNIVIEVKSTWTINLNKEDIISKLNASKDLGFNTLLWVFDEKGNLCEEHN